MPIKLLDKITILVNRLDEESSFPVLVLGLLPPLLLLLFPFTWNGNEEKYFISAYQRIAPELFSPFHAVFDQSNAKYLSEYLLGVLVNSFGYESAHAISRTLMALLYAISLGSFFSTLRLSLLKSMTIIAIFYYSQQQILGYEWLFNGVEAKTFAYAAVISALGFAWRKKWLAATLLMVLATYFHFLVGGFWALALALLMQLQTNKMRLPLKYLSGYLLLISPLIASIAIIQFGHPPITMVPGPDKIYAMSFPYHITPFASGHIFFQYWYPGVMASCSFLFAFLLLNKFADDKLFSFVSLLFFYLLLALLISLIDRNTLFLAKFFLFRPSSLILLLAITSIIMLLESKLNIEGKYIFQITQAAIVLYFLGNLLFPTAYAFYEDIDNALPGQQALIEAIETNSKPGEIVLIEPYREMKKPYVGLPRKLPRPTLVSKKFTPNNPLQIERWYELINFRKTFFENGCSQPSRYPIRLLLVFRQQTLEHVKGCGEIVWQMYATSLVRIDKHTLQAGKIILDTDSPLK
ncbi:MAG: hypothetical protein WCH04_07160 [Gammaproteobacteria bacterium]